MLNREPALRRRHRGDTFSATGHSATHSDVRPCQCIGVASATEPTIAETAGAETTIAETAGAEPTSAEATLTEADGVQKTSF